MTLHLPTDGDQPADFNLEPGSKIDNWIIDCKIGQGGMGAVFKAHDPSVSSYVAIKVIVASAANNPMILERFKREGKITNELRCEKFVTFYTGTQLSNGWPCLVMEFLEGCTLAQQLTELRTNAAHLPVKREAWIALEVANAMACAPSKG